MEKVFILIAGPCIVVFLVLAYMYLQTTKTKSARITLKGLGVSISIHTETKEGFKQGEEPCLTETNSR